MLFHPTVEEMYPAGSVGSTVVDVPGLSDILCGAFRPGHFQGVATVVVKLLNLVQPDVAIFGEKDYQQLTVIRRVVEDLNLPVRIVGAPDRARRGRPRAQFAQPLPVARPSARPRRRSTARSMRARRRLEAGDADYAAHRRQQGIEALRAGGHPARLLRGAHARRVCGRRPPRDVALVVLAAGRLGKARLIDNLQCQALRADLRPP